MDYEEFLWAIGDTTTTRLLADVFSEKYSDRTLDKYLVYTKDLKKDSDILMIPVYMLPFLK